MGQRERAFLAGGVFEQSGNRGDHVMFEQLPKAHVARALCTIVQASCAFHH